MFHPLGTLLSLPTDIRLCESILTFKRHLKTRLFLMCCLKRLCIFGPKCAVQIRYYYYYYLTFFNLPRPAATATATAATAATATA